MTTTRGMLLVATPPLDDPNFDRTVVFMLEHNEDGAVGVVINRPGLVGLPDTIDQWQGLLTEPAVLFQGGPVEPDALIALARIDGEPDDGWSRVVGDIGSIDLVLEPDDLTDEVTRLRVFRGYSGWGPGQLDGELEEGAWMVLPSEPDDVFTAEPTSLWRAVIRRQGGRIAWIANAPDDLSLN